MRTPEKRDLRELSYKRCSLRADGPVSAYHYSLLWETMIQNLDPRRLDRAQIRGGIASSGRGVRQQDIEATLGLREKYPDGHWKKLYMETSLQLPFEIHAALWAPYCDPATGTLREQPPGQLGFYILNRMPDVVRESPLPDRLDRVLNTAAGLGDGENIWSVPSINLTIAPPVVVERDLDGILHSPAGPTGVWRDGSTVYYWRGMMCPAEWLPQVDEDWMAARPGAPTPLKRNLGYKPPTVDDAFNTLNLEHRRMATEIIGFEQIIEDLTAIGRKPIVLDVDPDPEIGTLMKMTLPVPPGMWGVREDEQYFLRVKCGTGRGFSLAVPPTMRTAREANAWTYDLDPDELQPEVRT